jgi:NADPH:quinone reductase-like Zn-dependent oxidoreductase
MTQEKVQHQQASLGVSGTMQAVRLHAPGGIESLRLDTIDIPRPQAGEVLIRVHAAAITRDERDWPTDRLPAIPSYEVSGVVVAVAPGLDAAGVGEAVYALTGFDRDGAAAEYAVVPADFVAARPRSLNDVESAALPLAGLSAWQGLFDHGALEPGQRVLIHGAAGGVGHLAVQLARRHGAYVIGTTSAAGAAAARSLGADEVLDAASFATALAPVDLVFDTVGGDRLARSAAVICPGGRLVSIAEEVPETAVGSSILTLYFVVVPNRGQLVELARIADEDGLRIDIDSTFTLADARTAFERSMATGKHGKVVFRIHE